MADTHSSLEDRISKLESQVQALTLRVEKLADVREIGGGEVFNAGQTDSDLTSNESFVPGEELLKWVGKSSLLARISAICFILVIALILRTVTDNGLLNKEVGSLVGMVYAGTLIVLGWRRYARKSPLAPVFASFGAVLMFSIVLETHAHFKALPSVPAYLILIGTGCAMTAISFLFKVDLPIQVGALGMCIAGAALDFPNPVFFHLATLLFIANVIGYLASRLGRCPWLRWILFGITLAMLQVWVFKLGRITLQQVPAAKILTPDLFLPTLALFAVCFVAMALARMLRRGDTRVSKFDFFLPSLYFLWAYLAAGQFFQTTGGIHRFSLGLVGTLIAVVFLGIAFGLTRKAEDNRPLLNSFLLGAVVLLPLSLPALFGNQPAALLVLSLTAFGLGVASKKWRSGGVRGMAYLLQLYACIMLASLLWGKAPHPPILATIGVAALASVISLSQYTWCRKNPPLPNMVFFSRFDEEDRTAVLLFLEALVSFFFFIRGALFLMLHPTAHPEAMIAFRCSQSIAINATAAILMVIAFVRRNKEWRNISILLTIVGGANVFLYDLFLTHGFPLVASVFTFGVAAALESVTLSRW